jgi:hypothetical protein
LRDRDNSQRFGCILGRKSFTVSRLATPVYRPAGQSPFQRLRRGCRRLRIRCIRCELNHIREEQASIHSAARRFGRIADDKRAAEYTLGPFFDGAPGYGEVLEGGTVKSTLQTREIACFRRVSFWVPVSCILLLFCLAAQAAEQTAASLVTRRTLHSISEVYALSKEEAKLGYPVDLEAVVTYYQRENPRLCRGGSSSLTFPGVHPETLQREPPSTRRGETGWTSMQA